MQHIDFTSVSSVTLVLALLLLIIQLYYFLGIYSRLHKCSKKQNKFPDNINCPPLSVIIVTKDSATALKENLPLILEQDYPDFEVIVVNDESAGGDEDILKIIETKYHNLYHTFIPKSARYISRKKLGVAMGLKASRYDWVVLTEPYCKPDSKNWLRDMARNFVPGTDIVLGYCNYSSCKGMFAKRIVSDMLINSMRFLGRAANGATYMGMGRNMAFRKEVYETHKGFAKQLQLLRGEDDLFINEIANKDNTKIAVSTDSIMRIPVPEYKRIWYGEKVGYEVTGKLYKGTARISNGFETSTAVLFNITAISCIAYSIVSKDWITASAAGFIFVLRLSIVIFTLIKNAKSMGESIRGYFFLYILLRPIYSLEIKCKYLMRTKADYLRK